MSNNGNISVLFCVHHYSIVRDWLVTILHLCNSIDKYNKVYQFYIYIYIYPKKTLSIQ